MSGGLWQCYCVAAAACVRFHVKQVRVFETVERSGSACFNSIKYSLAESVRLPTRERGFEHTGLATHRQGKEGVSAGLEEPLRGAYSISVVSEVPSSFSSVTHSWCWKETFAPCCRLRTRHFSFSDAVARYV